MWLLLLKRFWPYIAIAILGATVGAMTAKRLSEARYAALETTYANYRTHVAEQDSMAQKAAREAEAQHLAERIATDNLNAKVIHDLQETTAAIALDRDHSRELARRLLHAAKAGGTTTGGGVSQANGEPGVAPAPNGGGNEALEGLLVAAATECDIDRARYSALISQIAPQL